MTTKPIPDKTEVADRLAWLSAELHEVAADMDLLGQHLHAEQLTSTSALLSIYAHQLHGRAERDAELLDGGGL
jgi:hypothetical protein